MVKYIDIHTHKENLSTEVVTIYNVSLCDISSYLSLFSIGYHPYDVGKLDDSTIHKLLRQELNKNNCVALGEIGLDKRFRDSYSEQIRLFDLQLTIAEELDVPVILHNIKSTQEILSMLKGRRLKFIFHSFIGNIQTAYQIIDKGGMLSFGKSIFHHKASMECLNKIPANNIFFETDESDMSICDIYQQAEKLTGKEHVYWMEQVQLNFNQIFKQTIN